MKWSNQSIRLDHLGQHLTPTRNTLGIWEKSRNLNGKVMYLTIKINTVPTLLCSHHRFYSYEICCMTLSPMCSQLATYPSSR